MTSPLNFPALHASHAGIWMLEPGDLASDRAAPRVHGVSRGAAMGKVAETPVIMLNAPLVASRLGYPELSGLDLLELFAFIYPARFMVPTPKGLAEALGLDLAAYAAPAGDGSLADEAVPLLLRDAAEKLLFVLDGPWPEREGAWDVAQSLYRLRWPWAGLVNGRLKRPDKGERWLFSRLPEWEDAPERPQPAQIRLSEQAIRDRLSALTGQGAEDRPGQKALSVAAAHVFAPRKMRDAPNMLLAEAGTGIGKTLGYLAPASLWAQQAEGTVWVSTFTKALQRQLNQESRRIYPDANTFRKRVAVRKGRENYLCLLNLEDALQGGFSGRPAVMAQLVARWAAYSRDGDMVGGDLPGWLTTLFRQRGLASLTDRRGECIYAGCPHFRKCFIERANRASADADLVIANHALVMVNAARGRDPAQRPTRIIFDEGHHLFEAADSMFSAALTGQEAIELRRWIMGPEGNARGRRRGLAARLADLASYDEEGGAAIEAARVAASELPGDGWLQRINEGTPASTMERLLSAIRALVYARDESGGQDAGYGLETEITELDGPVLEAASDMAAAMDGLLKPLKILSHRIEALVEDGPDWMDGPARARMEGALSAIAWRSDLVSAWLAMLARLGAPADPGFVDWLAVERIEGREIDIGMFRHYLDPSKPLADTVLRPAHGVMVTSATLTDHGDWDAAMVRSGAMHIDAPVERLMVPSPFDYARQAEVLIVTDIPRGDMAALAGAYGQLIEAAGGGVLGLFTAIRRLRAVYGRISDRLARGGLPIFAQHVDPIDTSTLVDIFRDDPRASLLGTDALRDGVDVPGHSLRLVVMEGVPWPKPGILHRARRAAFGGSAYDDRIIRGRLAQAFGRLIRRGDDHGQFVLLSSAIPSRLLSAFPSGTTIRRVTLSDALQAVRSGVSGQHNKGHDSSLARSPAGTDPFGPTGS